MKRTCYFLAILATGTAAGYCAYLAAPQSKVPPGLWAINPVQDLGDRYQEEEIPLQFHLQNTFEGPVVIEGLIPSCSCTEANVSPDVLQPGEQATVDVVWATHASRGDTTTSLDVVYLAPSGNRSLLTLKLQANVIPDIRYDPEEVVFQADRPSEQIIRLTPGRLSEFTANQVSVTHRAFQAVLMPDGHRIAVRFNPSEWSGGIAPTAELKVRTSSDRVQNLIIPLKVKGVAPPSVEKPEDGTDPPTRTD